MLKGSTEAMQEQYQYSKVRSNLLNWYDFSKEDSMLIWGTVSESLREFFDRNLGRVKVVKEEKIVEEFDYVILIEDLESEEPLQLTTDLLEKMKVNLKEDGKLILALDNKMGMKYWSGAAQGNTGLPYAGLEGYVGKQRVEGYSREDVSNILRQGGFLHQEFYYPMPDFVFPTAIYSDEFLPQPGDLRGDSPAYQGENYRMFKENLVYEQVCRDGMFPYFANSFLIFANR